MSVNLADSGDLLMRQRSHPLRNALTEEMHIRKLPHFSAPARLLQVMMHHGETEIGQSHAQLARLCREMGVEVPGQTKYWARQFDGFELVWECHTEVATYTVICRDQRDHGLGMAAFPPVVADWLRRLPGEVLRATQIALVAADEGEAAINAIIGQFATEDLVVCDLAQGRARLWSDFRLHDDGWGRLLVLDNGLAGAEPAQIVQRLQEIGNYRNLALIGLPLAQGMTPQVTALEQRLSALTASVAAENSDDHALLAELSFLSAELARLTSATSYRMSATRAYSELSMDRLAALDAVAVPGYPTLADFTERRLRPAMRTCQSFSRRLEELSQRVAWTSSLLRTRVDTALAHQSRDLLASMDRRNDSQFRLQQTVEGLSLVAIAYYLVGLIGYLVKAAHSNYPGLPSEMIMGGAVPLVLAAIAGIMHRVHHRISG